MTHCSPNLHAQKVFRHRRKNTLHFKYGHFSELELTKARNSVIPQENIWNIVSYSCEHTFTQFMSLLQTVGKVRKLHMRGDVDFESDLRRLEIDLDTELKQIGCLSDAKNTLLNWLSAAVAVN